MSIRKNTITVKWRGVKQTQESFNAVPRAVRRGALNGLRAIALLLQNRCRMAIQKGPKSGRFYKRRGVVHQASAAGEFPASDTGTLVRSILGDVEEQTLEATLSAGTIYAKWLELGTRLMRARPFLVPTLDNVSEEAPSILRRFIKKELKNV